MCRTKTTIKVLYIFSIDVHIKQIFKNMTNNFYLDDQTGHRYDPVDKAGNAWKSSWVSQFTAAGRTEADKANLVVNSIVDVAQWTTRVTLF